MKKFLTKTFNSKPITVVLLILVAPTRLANADPLKEAHVSQIIQDVRLLEAHAAPHPAAVNDKVTVGSAVRTGVESRAELTFNDLTITRLGANTIFSFTAGARQAELTQGAILLQVRPGAPAVRANTTAVTVAVMGGTALLATGPPTKFMVLEGTGTIYPLGHPEKAVTVRGGEMVTAEGGRVNKPEKFDVKLVLATSPLITDFAPLTNLPLILAVVNQQALEQPVMVSNQPPYKSMIDTIDVTDQSANSNPTVVVVRIQTPTPSPTISPTITPSPTPTKFGTPATITSPNPYLITNGTVIKTDPSITTNGVTDYGKIYRGPVDDGPFSLWAFGSTSAFDNAIGFDAILADVGSLPIAVLKFQALSLTGNPTIDLTNGGVTKLGLIGVDGITSGSPGGILTFTGLDLLVLATVDGSINLGSDISFQGLNALAMYARGAGSNLILNSPISNIGILGLAAEGSIQLANPGTMSVGAFEATAGNNLTLQIGGSLLLDGKVRLKTLVLPGTTVANGANLTLNVTGNYTNSSATDSSHLNVMNEGAHIGTGGNIGVNIGGDLTTTGAGGDFDLLVQNTNGRIDNGGNITLNVNGGVSTKGQLSLVVENYDFSTNPAGHIGTGGNISVTTGGDLSADSISDVINNRNGGTIGSNVNLTLNIAGALTTAENGTDYFGESSSLSLFISNRYDNTLGSTIGGDATLGLSADSASIGGNLNAFISNRAGTIDGNALLSFATLHDFTIQGDASLGILVGPDAISPVGGTVHGSATLQLSAANLTANSLSVVIDNRNRDLTGSGGMIGGDANIIFNIGGNLSSSQGTFVQINNSNVGPGSGGVIGSGANLTFNVSGNLTEQTDATFQIQNAYPSSTPGGSGGTIHSDAVLTLSAGNISIGGGLDTSIRNARNAGSAGGTIGGSAILNVDVTGSITALDDLQFVNNGGGSIGSNAAIALSAASLATTDTTPGALSASINNSGGGNIGGSASINFDLSGNLTSASDATFSIDNSHGGSIGGAANVAVNVGNNVTVTGPNGIDVHILDGNSGHIVTGANVLYSVGGSTSTTQLLEYIDNTSGGAIDNGGNVTLHTVAPVMLDGPLVLEVDNYNGGTINNGANLMAHFVGDVTDTLGSAHSLNFNMINGSGFSTFQAPGGTIGIGGNINATFDGNAETTGTSTTGAFAANIYNGGGSITTGGNISVTVGGNLTCGNILSVATDNSGGHIGTGGNITLDVTGDITSVGARGAFIGLLNNGGTIGSGTSINVSAANVSSVSNAIFQIDNRNGGVIGSNATLTLNLAGNLTTQGGADIEILNDQNDSSNGLPGGSIVSAATLTISAADISIGTDFTARILNHRGTNAPGPNGGSIGTDATLSINAASLTVGGISEISIYNRDAGAGSGTGGSIGGNAAINLNIAGTLSSGGAADFLILNESVVAGSPGGTIGGSATINIGAANIGDSANHGDEVFDIDNRAGIINQGASISVAATNITANSLLAQIDNSNGGSIGGNAAINMNVSGNANITNNATVQILGSDGAASAAININGGNYNVGQTFLTYIDGNGTITFNNATAHADVLKAGVFGANGVLNIGGGMLSANSELKLYANGSNGALNFLSNVTLGGSAVKILAANSITIFNNIVVTINGPAPAEVFTTNANYTGFGGNGTTTGTFAGAGANNPLPLNQAPPFGAPPPSHAIRGTRTNPLRPPSPPAIHVNNTAELLALLDGATIGPDGKVRISDSKNISSPGNANRINMNILPRGVRGMLIRELRDRSAAARVDARRL